MPVRRIGLIVHQGRSAAVEVARAVHAWCDANRIRCTEIDVWAKEHRRGSREEAAAAA